jgi:pyridoxal 5-phosphate dependent beta-lyase
MSVDQWVRERLPSSVVHLDVAACGRVSAAVLDAQVAHLRAEAAVGGYVAEADELAIPAGRKALGGLVGLSGEDVAFVESGGAAFATLLAAWPLPSGSRIGTASSEYAPNALVLQRLATERGWRLVPLPVDALGRITDVPRDLDLVTFPQVPSQRGVAQPVELALASGVPLVLDVAQSLGQTAVPHGCAAYVGTSRKWLCGPRGVGFLVVDPSWERRLASPPTLAPTMYDGVRRFESGEAHVAGRAGLAVAAAEWTPELLPLVQTRATELRALLADLPGWRVVEPVDEPTGITTLTGGDPVAARAALLERGVLVSAVPVTRAADLTRPVLRLSTAAWATADDLERVRAALGSLG